MLVTAVFFAALALAAATANGWQAKYHLSNESCTPPIFEDGLTLFTVPDTGIRGLFGRNARYQGYLDAEAALALAEGELGVVPLNASLAIAAHADLSIINRTYMIELGIEENHPLMPLIGAFTKALDDRAGSSSSSSSSSSGAILPGQYVHWGATTQNIIQTGFTLALRRAQTILLRLLAGLLEAMAALARRSHDLVLAGRTHGQQAVPITFGFKVAGWIDEMRRHADRLKEGRPRLLTALMGGAVGSMASFEGKGRAVQGRVAAILGLRTLGVPMRSATDHFAEHVLALAMLGSTGARVANEVFSLMQNEFHEAEEPITAGTLGSSTMPQKRNPNIELDVVVHEAQLRALAGPALMSMQSLHEAQSSHPRIASYAVIEAVGLAGDILADLNYTLAGGSSRGLVLHNDSMWYNVKTLNRGLIMAERVMLALGRAIGRQSAHAVVYEAAQAAAKDASASFEDLLWADPRVVAALRSRAALEALMNPAAYTGESSAFALEQAGLADAAAAELRQAATQLEACDTLLAKEKDLVTSARPSVTPAQVKALEQACASK